MSSHNYSGGYIPDYAPYGYIPEESDPYFYDYGDLCDECEEDLLREDEEGNSWRDTPVLSDSELEWSRNRQAEWYTLFVKEHELTEDDYVDEQDLLDWLGAHFTISRIIKQEI